MQAWEEVKITLGFFMANRFVMETGRVLLCFCKAVVALLNLRNGKR